MKKINVKKLICFILIVSFALSFTACGNKEKQITSLEDLKGKRFGVQSGTIYDKIIASTPEFKGAKVNYLLSSADALAFLMAGKSDAFITDAPIAKSLVAQQQGLIILDETLNSTEYAMAFNKGDELQYEVNAVIEKFKDNGTLDQLTNKWITNPAATINVVQQTWAGTRGTIIICISPDLEPICYLDENENPQGFETDLALRIAKELDYKVKFVSTNFEDLLGSVESDMADIALGAVSITDERKAQVDFSKPYLDSSIVVVVKDVNAENAPIGDSLKNSIKKYFVEEDRWQILLSGITTTLELVIIPIVVGLILGTGLFLWAYTGAHIPAAIGKVVSKFLSLVPGSTWLLFVFYVIFLGNNMSAFIAALVAFSVSFSMDVYGIISGSINAIDPGQKEAAYSMGYSKFGALFHILLPQALPNIVATLRGPCIGEIKMTALVEFIAVGDLQTNSDIIRSNTLEPFLPIVFCTVIYALIIFIATKIIDLIIRKINKRVDDEALIKERLLEGKI